MSILIVSVALVDAGISLSGWVYLHLGLDSVLPSPILADLYRENKMGLNLIF
jgi:hypothetical protein